ncbi:MAG: hypothetical protein AB1742_15920 [bacterium]
MKKIEESKAMLEIREIRRKQYEETKGLSSEEQIAYDKKLSDEFEKESGVKLRRLSKVTR